MGVLRVLLAIAVVIAHSNTVFGLKLTGGVVAVEVFFIISGFYMSMILDKKYVGKGSYRLFLSNRFLRLYPMFWVVLLLTALVSIVSYFFTGNAFKLSAYIKYFDLLAIETLFFQIVTNIVLFGQDIVMFLGVNAETGGMYFTHDFKSASPAFHSFLLVPQAWSLGIEVMFYLIAPFLVRKSNVFILSMIALSLLIRLFTYFFLGYLNDPWTYRFFPSELALFLLGTVSFRLYSVYKIQKVRIYNRDISVVVIGFVFLSILFYQFVPGSEFRYAVNWLFYGLICLSIPFLFSVSKLSKLDSRIGELSYPIYITHILVIACMSPVLSFAGWQDYKGELAVIFTLLVSFLLVRWISDPIERIRRGRVAVVDC